MAGRPKLLTAKARGIAALAIVAALFAAIYVTLDRQGNGGTEAAACTPAAEQAKALDPLVTGEVAALQLARRPQDLSSVAFKGTDGKPMTLAAFKGKVALVNLWATWCAPCRQEMPALDRLQAALGGDAFTVVPISIDTGDAARPAAFLASVGVTNLPLYRDPSTDIFEEVKQRGLAIGLPVTVLVDRRGCHLGHMNGPAEWDSDDGRALIEAAIGESEQLGPM
jgi:thiol-disulfide isomerase/thioredoxin